MHIRGRLVVCLSAVLLLASCSGDAKNTSGAAPGSGSAEKATDSPAPTERAASAPQPMGLARCLVDDQAPSNVCNNVLPREWASLSEKEQMTALQDVTWQAANYRGIARRYTSTSCTNGQPKQVARAPKDSRRMDDLVNWKPGVTVAMVKFISEGNGTCRDNVYGVAKSERLYFLVFTVASSLTTDAKGDTILGKWSVLSFTATGKKRVESSGVYTRCSVEHPENHIASVSEFHTCSQKRTLYTIASQFQLTVDELVAKLDSLRGGAPKSYSALKATGTPLDKALAAFAETLDDDAPVWTTCALGCCVAEQPVLRSSARESEPLQVPEGATGRSARTSGRVLPTPGS